MRRTTLSALVLVLVAPAVMADEMPWAKDWETAKTTGGKENKLIMVDFFTDW